MQGYTLELDRLFFSHKMVGFWKIFESGTFNMIKGKKGNLKQLRFGIYISYRSRSALLKGKIRNRNFVQGWLRILNIPKGPEPLLKCLNTMPG